MTDNQFSSETVVKSNELHETKSHAGILLVLLILLVVSAGAGFLFMRTHLMTAVTVAPSSTAAVMQMEQRIIRIEQQVQALDSRLNDLNARVDKLPSVPVNAEPSDSQAPVSAPSPATTQALARMQNDLTGLSAALASIQIEVRKNGNVAEQTQQTTQNALAAVVAFIQLHETADAGRGFAKDFSALRSVAGNDAHLQELFAKLEPYAAKGAPTIVGLHDEFQNLERPANVAIAKATAQDWWHRLQADFQNLVSVRPLHGGATPDAFVGAETALSSGDLAAALDAVKALPPEAQGVLKEWRAKAEARQEIDTVLHALSDHFVGGSSAASVPEAPRDQP